MKEPTTMERNEKDGEPSPVDVETLGIFRTGFFGFIARLRIFARFRSVESAIFETVRRSRDSFRVAMKAQAASEARISRRIDSLRSDLSKLVPCAAGCGRVFLTGSEGIVTGKDPETGERVELCHVCGPREWRKDRRKRRRRG